MSGCHPGQKFPVPRGRHVQRGSTLRPGSILPCLKCIRQSGRTLIIMTAGPGPCYWRSGRRTWCAFHRTGCRGSKPREPSGSRSPSLPGRHGSVITRAPASAGIYRNNTGRDGPQKGGASASNPRCATGLFGHPCIEVATETATNIYPARR